MQAFQRSGIVVVVELPDLGGKRVANRHLAYQSTPSTPSNVFGSFQIVCDALLGADDVLSQHLVRIPRESLISISAFVLPACLQACRRHGPQLALQIILKLDAFVAFTDELVILTAASDRLVSMSNIPFRP